VAAILIKIKLNNKINQRIITEITNNYVNLYSVSIDDYLDRVDSIHSLI